MKLLLILSSVLAVSGASAAAPAKLEGFMIKEVRQSGNLMPGPGRRRPVRSVVIFEANTGGCTKVEDFELKVKDSAQYQEVTLVRTKPDVCEVSRKETFELETGALMPSHSKPIQIRNPVIVEEHFVH